MISVMWANNEVGTIQPIAELASVAHKHQIPFHTDAVQAAGQVPVNFAASGVDALTITGHKIGGPVGAGALLLGRGIEPVPVMHGGGQERDVRSGTLDAPAIAACTAGVAQPSHVLLAIGADEARARGSLRFSLGSTSTPDDVAALGSVIGEVVERARRANKP